MVKRALTGVRFSCASEHTSACTHKGLHCTRSYVFIFPLPLLTPRKTCPVPPGDKRRDT